MKSDRLWSLSWLILSGIKLGEIDQADKLKIIHENINQNWLKTIDYPEVHYILYKIYNELQISDKSKLHLDKAYNRLIEISHTFTKKEYKLSIMQARFHNEIVKEWEKVK